MGSEMGTWYSERVILQFMCAGCLAGVTYLRSVHSADESQIGRNSCPLLRSWYIGSCHVGVSKRFSCSISLTVFILITSLYFLLDSMFIKLYETLKMDNTQRLKDERSSFNYENPNIFRSRLERLLHQPKLLGKWSKLLCSNKTHQTTK